MLVVAAASVLALAGCAGDGSVVVNTQDAGSGTSAPVPNSSDSSDSGSSDSTDAADSSATDSSAPGSGYTGLWLIGNTQPETLATGLESPWSVIPYQDGYLVSQRDNGEIIHIAADGTQTSIGEVEGVVSGGESGLHGLALLEDADQTYLYAYHGAADDNRVVRMPLEHDGNNLALGAPEPIVTGIPRGDTHNGGRIHFGPDGYLHISTGDAQQGDDAQDPDSLAGKILRVDSEGNPAPDNPFDNLVYSLGHRNVQGFAWTSDGTMWASEFGQNTWDELNVIESGGNYGWPTVEGIADDERFIDPRIQWSPAEASPSGMAAKGDTLVLATLRGQQLWVIETAGGEVTVDPTAVVPDGVTARLRDAQIDSAGNLLVLTNNTDGRGNPSEDDDRLLQLDLIPAE